MRSGSDDTDGEKSYFRRIEIEVKKLVFNLFLNVMKQQEPNIYLNGLLFIIMYFQAIYYCFYDMFVNSWGYPDISSNVQLILGYLHVSNHMKEVGWSGYIAFFYIVVGYVSIIMLLSILVSYAANFTQHYGWPLPFLRFNYILLSTIFFMPGLQLLLSIFMCDEKHGKSVHTFYPTVQCYQSMHIIHVSVSLLFILIFLFFTIFPTMTCFEARYLSQELNGRKSSKPHIFFMIYIFIKIVLFSTLRRNKFNYLLALFMLIGTAINYYIYYRNRVYYHVEVHKFYMILKAILVFTNILLMCAIVLEENMFQGTVIMWIVSIPLIFFIILLNRIDKSEMFLWVPQQLNTEQDILNYTSMMINLEKQQSDKRYRILLETFVSVHVRVCLAPDCTLKISQSQNNQNRKILAQEENTDGNISLTSQILQIFNEAIKKFPNSYKMHIELMLYLVTQDKFQQQAMQQILAAEKCSPTFEYDFIIYRYQIMLQDQISDKKNEDSMDIVSQLAFQAFLRSFQGSIERISIMYMEFWQQLNEDLADIGKMYQLGVKIGIHYNQINEQWKRLQKLNSNSSNMSAAYRLFGRFLCEITNEEVLGRELLHQARDFHKLNQNKFDQIYTNLEDLANEPTATLIISSDQEKFGMIIGSNLAASNLLGYPQIELIGRKVNSLMPNQIAEKHDEFVRLYLERLEHGVKQERSLLMMNKSKYLFPSYLNLRTLQFTTDASVSIIGGIRVDQYFRKLHYLLLDDDGNIDYISANTIPVIKADRGWFDGKKKRNISKLFPNLFQEREQVKSQIKQGVIRTLMIPNYRKKTEYQVLKIHRGQQNLDLAENDQQDAVKGERLSAQVFLYEYLSSSNGAKMGWVCRFELKEFQKDLLNLSKDNLRRKTNSFQFGFKPSTSTYIGQFTNMSNSEVGSVIDSGNNNNNTFVENEKVADPQHATFSGQPQMNLLASVGLAPTPGNSSVIQYSERQFGTDIKIYRLYNDGVVREPDEDQFSDSDEEENSSLEASKQGKKQAGGNGVASLAHEQEDEQEVLGYGDYKNQRIMKAVIKDEKEPSIIRILKIGMNLMVIGMLVYAFVQYLLVTTRFNQAQGFVNVIRLAGNRNSQLMRILSTQRDLKNLVRGTFNLTLLEKQIGSSFNYDMTGVEMMRLLTNMIQDLEGIHREILLYGPIGSNQQMALFNSDSILIQYQNGDKKLFDIKQSTEQMINYGFQLTANPYSLITGSGIPEWFIETNLYSDYYTTMLRSYNLYVKDLKDLNNDHSLELLKLLISAIVIHFVFFFIFSIFSSLVIQNVEQMLCLFLDLPTRNIRILHSKCQAFISNLQVGDDQDEISIGQIQNLVSLDESEGSSYVRKRKKKFKNSTMSNKFMLLSFLISLLIIQAYYIANYYLGTNLLDKANILIDEFNITCFSEANFYLTTNVHRQLFFDTAYKTYSKPDIYQYSKEILDDNYETNANIHKSFSKNQGIHTSQFVDAYKTLMMGNACDIFVTYAKQNKEDCERFSNGILQQGFAYAVTWYLEQTKTLYNIFSLFYNDVSLDFYETVPSYGFYFRYNFAQPLKNIGASILAAYPALDSREFENLYLQSGMRYLNQMFQQDIVDIFNEHLLIRLMVYIVINILIIISFLLGWLPYLGKQKTDLLRTRSMLRMIPLSLVTQTKSIQNFLKKYVSQYNVDDT